MATAAHLLLQFGGFDSRVSGAFLAGDCTNLVTISLQCTAGPTATMTLSVPEQICEDGPSFACHTKALELHACLFVFSGKSFLTVPGEWTLWPFLP